MVALSEMNKARINVEALVTSYQKLDQLMALEQT